VAAALVAARRKTNLGLRGGSGDPSSEESLRNEVSLTRLDEVSGSVLVRYVGVGVDRLGKVVLRGLGLACS
jgi:hypothetical protein